MLESGVLVGESLASFDGGFLGCLRKDLRILAKAYSCWSEVSSRACSVGAVACGLNLVHYAGQ